MASIKFSSIPDSDFSVQEGKYPLVCLEAKLVTSINGYKMIELSWEHLGDPKFKINFDRYIYGTSTKDFDMENAGCRFGLQKLKALNECTVNVDNLDPAIFVKLIVGKKVEAFVTLRENNKGAKYPEINNKDFFKYEEAAQPTQVPTSEQVSFNVNVEEDPFEGM